MLELELCSEKVTGERDALQERLHTLESSWKELSDEYIILKSNYLALGKELEQEVRQVVVFALVFSTPSPRDLICSQRVWLGVAYPCHNSGPVRFVSCDMASLGHGFVFRAQGFPVTWSPSSRACRTCSVQQGQC